MNDASVPSARQSFSPSFRKHPHRTFVPAFMKSCIALLLLFVGDLAFAHDTGVFPSLSPGLKVLVYSNTAYYRHPDIPGINRWLVLLGHEQGIDVDITENALDLAPKAIARYDVLLLNNANELDKIIPEEQRKSVEQWFTTGKKGIVGLHAALVHQKNWPWLTELAGCDFNSDSDYSKAKITIDPAAKDHPAVKGQPAEFWYEADWTNHDRVVTGLPGFTVLMRVDESTYTPVRPFFQTRGGKPMGKDHPIAWTHEPATGGRFFYTEFGHDLRALNTPFARQHILEGIKWAAAAPKSGAAAPAR
jgi:type 1 glutamine amidotransferase